MIDALHKLLNWSDIQDVAPLQVEEANRWSVGAVDLFVAMGLIRPTTPATCIRYDYDHSCYVEPRIITHAVTGERFGVHACVYECGLVRIPLDDLRRWEFDLLGAAKAIAHAIDAGGRVVEDVPDRLVALGSVVAGDIRRDVFLARGTHWDDAEAVMADARHLKAAAAPLVLVLARLPGHPLWSDCKPALAVLDEMVSLSKSGVTVDLSPVFGRPTTPQTDAIENKWFTVTEAAKRLQSDISGVTLVQAKARVSKAANAGKFLTNGKQRQARRIDRDSFSTWRLEQREKELATYR